MPTSDQYVAKLSRVPCRRMTDAQPTEPYMSENEFLQATREEEDDITA